VLKAGKALNERKAEVRRYWEFVFRASFYLPYTECT